MLSLNEFILLVEDYLSKVFDDVIKLTSEAGFLEGEIPVLFCKNKQYLENYPPRLERGIILLEDGIVKYFFCHYRNRCFELCKFVKELSNQKPVYLLDEMKVYLIKKHISKIIEVR